MLETKIKKRKIDIKKKKKKPEHVSSCNDRVELRFPAPINTTILYTSPDLYNYREN